MDICSLDALKESSKKKETKIKKEIVEVSQQASYRKKRTGKKKIGMTKLVFVGYNSTDFNFIFCYYWLFLKRQLLRKELT